MGVIFNADYEKVLSLEKRELVSNAINQELEYLLFWIQELPVYTTKKYDNSYLEYVQKQSKFSPKICTNKANLLPWWGKLQDIDFERKMNSKITSFEIAEKFNLNHPSFKRMRNGLCQKDLYYKVAWGMSGRGFSKGKIPKGVNYNDVIEMPLLERVLDFSFLKFDDKLPGVIYQNIVDSKFQYKSTIMGDHLPLNLVDDYKILIAPVEEYLFELGARAVWCVDSFLYKENNELKILAISEINYRKTMGYITYLFSKIYGSDSKYTQLILSKNEIQNKKLLRLSPKGNKFCTYLLNTNEKSDLII